MTHRPSIGLVFTIVLIDMLGFGIVIPVLPQLIMHLGHLPIDSAAVYAGWLGAGYASMQFIFAPIIGSLSDRFGRRPVLLAALLGFGIDYAVMGFAPTLGWLVVGRIAAGITGASFSTAYAYIADITPPEKRAASFGVMGMAFGFGFIVGPALGGLLGTLGPRVPFFAAAGLALVNFLIGSFVLRESLAPENRRPFSWKRANALGALMTLRGQSATVLWFVAALGTWQLAHIVYPAIWAYFAIAAYGFGQREVGLALGMVGLSSALVQGLGLRLLAPRLGETRAVAIGVIAVCASAILYAVARSTPMVYLAICVGALQGFIQPSIAALNSRAIDARSQGELQGATQSIGSIAAIVGPPLYSGVFAKFSGPAAIVHLPAMPLLVAAVFALASLAFFLGGTRHLKRGGVTIAAF
ncbi:MFS transporter, DHA1 family, tetracycline resistance protein [Novosphingobium sp. CF614]|uniref:TCR/Tet family MFS transporter n=1 Tax=Novosphingobium sp. CF614 TaxID=1884364 RepID=UPI0008E5491B|nr:TCR/Tet family MFS transporter [Novosphingobium sp. CF614]SFF91996.1 MFS transporter, DHA1 family, tetracycline resistance protein [Novosphingobium sp. CF614]